MSIIKLNNLLSLLLVLILVTTYSGNLKLFPVTGLLIIFILISSYSVVGSVKIDNYKRSYIFLISFWLIYCTVLTIVSPSIFYGLNKLSFMFLYSLVGVLIISMSIKEDFKRYIYLYPLSILVVMLWSFGTPFTVVEKMSDTFFRLGEEADSNPIMVARGMGLSIIFLVYLSTRVSKFRVIYIGLIGVSLVYMISSGSKGPLLALLASYTFSSLYFSKISKRQFFGLIVISLLLVNMYGLLLADDGFLSQRFLNEGSVNSRLGQYRIISDGIINGSLSDLIFGHGLGSYSYLNSGDDIRDYPHNLLLEVVYELGLIGFLVLISIFAYPILISKKFNTKIGTDPFMVAFIFYIFNSLFSGDLLSNTQWITFACLSLSYLKE